MGAIDITARDAQHEIEVLLKYGLVQGMLDEFDVDYTRNRLLELFQLDESYTYNGELHVDLPEHLEPSLRILIDYGYKIGLIEEDTETYRDLLDARIMGLMMARPSEIVHTFEKTRTNFGIESATNQFYKLCVASNYIRMDRVAQNMYWKQASAYGEMEITINLSKPEKNPKEIAMAKLLPPSAYPKCQLCRENIGYAGRINHPARQNLRTIPLSLNGESWLFQYSPYVYYNEHCIVLHHDHLPMKLTKQTFKRLLDFTTQFPHYFIGSNADLPIVGGSILTHDHFQGGRHTFPLEKAVVEHSYEHSAYPGILASIVKWPMSVLRLHGHDPDVLVEAANDLYEQWKQYSDPHADVLAFSEDSGEMIPHNTVTPIVRRSSDGGYEVDIVLRNNRCNEEHPEGIFHPHREMHHIKKENIGLIEVMGLAILPGRLKQELSDIADIVSGDHKLHEAALSGTVSHLEVHVPWIKQLVEKYGMGSSRDEAWKLVQHQVGNIFTRILEQAGVFKTDVQGRRAFERFVKSAGYSSVPSTT